MKNESKKVATAIKNETVVAKQTEKADNKPLGVAKPQTPEAVKALWEKAVAAKNAAAQGLLDQAVADDLWAKAEEASKPTPEALERNEKAKVALKAARKTAKLARPDVEPKQGCW